MMVDRGPPVVDPLDLLYVVPAVSEVDGPCTPRPTLSWGKGKGRRLIYTD